MLFIGPTPLAGIGQCMLKYLDIFPGSKYLELGHVTREACQGAEIFMFPLPIEPWLSMIPQIKELAKSIICMTICETETVHEDYGKLFAMFENIAVSSEYCKRVFSRQFPDTQFHIIRAYVPRVAQQLSVPPSSIYRFYHIGNILDQRKNVNDILRAFTTLNLPDCELVIKATCKQDVKIEHPKIKVINGLLEQDKIDQIHTMCDCYVSFSNSEGIGLGAVEAALRNKPVILPEYGGAPDYIKSDYMISCGTQEVPNDDFLFKKGMIWGKPNFEQLKEFMLDAHTKKVREVDHSFTRQRVSKEEISEQFKAFPH
jgi:glycosyltransferase involved in cell wall biosynthesis